MTKIIPFLQFVNCSIYGLWENGHIDEEEIKSILKLNG